MIVKCIANTGATLPAEFCNIEYGIINETSYRLTIGKHYLVLGIASLLGYNFFYVLEDDAPDSPALVPSLLFEVIDGQLSKHWHYQQQITGDGLLDYTYMISFLEWNDGSMFLENLLDGFASEVARFQQQVAMLRTKFNVSNDVG